MSTEYLKEDHESYMNYLDPKKKESRYRKRLNFMFS